MVIRRNKTGEADSIYLIFVTICESAKKTNTDNTVGSETSGRVFEKARRDDHHGSWRHCKLSAENLVTQSLLKPDGQNGRMKVGLAFAEVKHN